MIDNPPNTLTSLQCRMARAGLRWTVPDLAKRAAIGENTIIRFEKGESKSNASTRMLIVRAFRDAGVEFIEDCGLIIRGGGS